MSIFACKQGQASQGRVEICMLIPFSDQSRQSKSALTRSNGHTYEQCLFLESIYLLCSFLWTSYFKAEDEYLARKSE